VAPIVGDSTQDVGNEIADDFDDREMIEAAYPILYGRAVTEPEVAAGLAFLAEQRGSLLEKETAAVAETGEATPSEGGAGTADGDPRVVAERNAKMKAWIQYARALFSAAEFRYVN